MESIFLDAFSLAIRHPWWLRDGTKLDALYAIELDDDPDNPADYRPTAGQDPDFPGGASCSDWWHEARKNSFEVIDGGLR